jgi:small-conductance mechanosensitive channel
MAPKALAGAESSSAASGVRGVVRTVTLCAALLGAALAALAQTPPAASQTSPPAPVGIVAAGDGAERAGETFTFTFANRPIVVFRAVVLGRRPNERAAGAGRILDDLISQRISGPVASQAFDGIMLISVGSRAVFGLTEPDIDELSGETMAGVAAQTVDRLRQALDEAVEARTPQALIVSAISAGAGLIGGALVIWGLVRMHRAFATRLVEAAEQKLANVGIADVSTLRASRVLDFQRGLLRTIAVGLGLLVTYSTLTFILRRFPYTRPWGEEMRGYLLSTVETLGLSVLDSIPGLFAVALIFLMTRFLTRLVALWFKGIEQGRTHVRWLYPETAKPTRQLTTWLLWVFALVMAYPYMPGSGTDAFKGMSVFLGLMLTFGSSGLVNQIMSSFMLTYSRALRVGDFVRIGDVEGTVIHLGMLSTKVKTIQGEEVTIPNAVVVSQTTTDYTRFSDQEGVLTPTSVTIGYDTPWRQVQALLLQAAERTPGLRKEPKPMVCQVSLEDFYVKYTLFVALERQETRIFVFHDLHANIQDLFNEYGVQIMSPNYIVDPSAPKVVPKKNWYAAPARPD